MKICIYGAGAIGGYLAVELAQVPGIDVSVIARGEHLAAIRRKGLALRIDGTTRSAKLAATGDSADLGPQDAVIVALKAHQAWEVADRMAPLLGPHTAVVTCQNGVPWWYFFGLEGPFENLRLTSVDRDNRQWEAIGPERAIGCVVYPATEVAEPGVIVHKYGNKFSIGEPSGADSERCRRLGEVMEAAGLKAPVLSNIRDEIWLKLWGNLCFNPISALTRATLDIVATDPATRALSAAMMQEAYDVATKIGAAFRVDMERRINGAAKVGAHRTSMLQDLEMGRMMEVDALVTAVQEIGRLVEVETPYLDAVLGLVQQLGRSNGLYPTFPESEAISERTVKALAVA
jgi:2-dehydropantoate 2-reductase